MSTTIHRKNCIYLVFDSREVTYQTRTLILSEELWHSLKSELWKKVIEYIYKDWCSIVKKLEQCSSRQQNWDQLHDIPKTVCLFLHGGIVRKVRCSFYSQIKLFIPVGVEVLGDGFCALLDFSDLHGDVWITRTCFIFANQALSTYHW